jgi:hypothetical protein
MRDAADEERSVESHCEVVAPRRGEVIRRSGLGEGALENWKGARRNTNKVAEPHWAIAVNEERGEREEGPRLEYSSTRARAGTPPHRVVLVGARSPKSAASYTGAFKPACQRAHTSARFSSQERRCFPRRTTRRAALFTGSSNRQSFHFFPKWFTSRMSPFRCAPATIESRPALAKDATHSRRPAPASRLKPVYARRR